MVNCIVNVGLANGAFSASASKTEFPSGAWVVSPSEMEEAIFACTPAAVTAFAVSVPVTTSAVVAKASTPLAPSVPAVQFDNTPDEGVPRAGVTRAGEIDITTLPVPVIGLETRALEALVNTGREAVNPLKVTPTYVGEEEVSND